MQLTNLVEKIINKLEAFRKMSAEEPESIRTTYYESFQEIYSKLKTIIDLSKDPSGNESDLIEFTKDLHSKIRDILDHVPGNYKEILFETKRILEEVLYLRETINKKYEDICELLGINITDTSVEFLEDLVQILTNYRIGILFIDHEKLSRKFSRQYKNFFGRILGGYKKNIALLKSLSIDGEINEERMPGDLIIAEKVAKKLGNVRSDCDEEKLVSMLLVVKENIGKYKKTLDVLFETLKITNAKVSEFLGNLKCLAIFQKPDDFRSEVNFDLNWLQGMLQVVESLKSLLKDIYTIVDIGNLVESGFIRDYETALAFFNNLKKELPNIEEWFSLKNSMQFLIENGLEDFLKKTDTRGERSPNLVNIFLKGFFSDLLSKFYEEDKMLGMLSKKERISLIEDFKELDTKQQSLARHRLVEHLTRKMPEIGSIQVESAEPSILKREISKKRRNMSIRRLFSETPNLLKALKPCMMMSPLSVSIFLDPQFFKFDVVIFDEASQVFPEDAVGAIMRGKQIVVVGDNKQLPPTSFFKVSEPETELEDHEEDLESLESILDECMTAGLLQKSLLWHYRSKHESLISFSNYHFYKNRLNTFPSSTFDDQDSGIDFCYVENGVYDRSKSRKNRIEAMKVAEMVMEHARNKPNVSLGIVAFSEAQQTAILDQLEVLRKEDPSLEEFFQEDKPEEFFVKNLENVQGDERDEMIFSIGYGKDSNGRLTMNFGPLNKSGGERRLNVAITRARQKVTVVSSIKASDIPSEVTNPGVKALREYLMYAESGGLKEFLVNKAEYTGGDFESPFEESVYDALTETGLTLHKQVGCSSYRIDLAVVDTENPGRYLLGIECDGAMYHSAKTARDRDRLRQQVLEGLGWKIIRVWSRDWLLDKKSEVERILRAVEEARATSSGEKIIKKIEETEYFEIDSLKNDSVKPRIATYERFSYEDSQKVKTFTQLIDGIIQKEFPIHVDELLSRIRKYCDFGKISEVPDIFSDRGNLSHKKLKDFVVNHVRKKYTLSQDQFILKVDGEIVPRRANGNEKLKPEHIYSLEIQKAIKHIIENAFSINSDDLIKSVANFFGYSRAGEKISKRIMVEIHELIRKEEIVNNNGKLTLVENKIRNKSAQMMN